MDVPARVLEELGIYKEIPMPRKAPETQRNDIVQCAFGIWVNGTGHLFYSDIILVELLLLGFWTCKVN